MTKELRTSCLRVAIALLLIAASIVVYVTQPANTEQLVLQGIVFVCAFGMLAQGVTGVIAARRR
ncbi:hypothetical protein [Kutzneria kofuensis]|uniref:Uncharacterized protein n=1 Tax=Kutzneria kofuensis TaxID=103725 RepID=A0A7W9KLY1_9PSEU|nr:hypothetical protein [Kutzneria kofuensis]MBB5894976.1 hypothetical protein [Kutzneria kofuensis]